MEVEVELQELVVEHLCQAVEEEHHLELEEELLLLVMEVERQGVEGELHQVVVVVHL